MNVLTNLDIAGVEVPPKLSPRFDQALIGYLVRYDTPKGMAAYSVSRVNRLAKGLNNFPEDPNVDYAVVEDCPDFRAFGELIAKGMQVWEGLNGAIVGLVFHEDEHVPVYHYDLAVRILQGSFVDSEVSDIKDAVEKYFEEQIMLAEYGPYTPFVLRGSDYIPSDQNGLGGASALKLPSGKRGLSAYIEKQANAQRSRDSSADSKRQGDSKVVGT